MQFSDDQQRQSSSSSREGLQQTANVDVITAGGAAVGDMQQKLEAGALNNVWEYEEILNILGECYLCIF